MTKENYKSMKNFRGISNLVRWNSPGRNFIENGSMSVPLERGHVYTEADLFKDEVNYMIRTAKTHEDLNGIGRKLNYAIDNGMYEVGITNLQFEASKKMGEIYNKIGEYSGE